MSKQRRSIVVAAVFIGLLAIAFGGVMVYGTMSEKGPLSLSEVLADLDSDIGELDADSDMSDLTADQLGMEYVSESIDQTVEENEGSVDELDEALDLSDLDADDFGY
ncbi:MAG: hypothetical protein QY318_04490 [Candidatus Dojkabacteria bacterium]|nr:MAG: hypothetical protein QY318_04490 [Candidatus Dojkabacteria bacterium]